MEHFTALAPLDEVTVIKRTVFFVSDQTGITAETMGHSLMTQFDGIEFRQVTVPFISTVDKAIEAVRKIDLVAAQEGVRPVVFSTLVQEDVRNVVRGSTGFFLDFFDPFLAPLAGELKTQSSHTAGRTHRMADMHAYATRIDATNFALANDDGSVVRDYERADVILVGVSRSGKTPTCLYLAMQYGVFAANYPLTDDDLDVVAGSRDKLVGRIQERYGIAKEAAEKEVDAWSVPSSETAEDRQREQEKQRKTA